ncbi:hypothetical protein C7212DRAFT_310618 [Tuber magnatum]|uniref:Uncharacterized protein n=1 Tax=Tuber magnatum TaxID=42249 RepID=A0A317T2E3_9PEZI|nr:hypothetical protein C7212DRAFT_310618 [Tuber magnatum]
MSLIPPLSSSIVLAQASPTCRHDDNANILYMFRSLFYVLFRSMSRLVKLELDARAISAPAYLSHGAPLVL